jgi:hypothetical protein
MMAASTNDCSPSWSVYIEYLQLLNIYRHVFVCKVDLVSNEVGHILAQLGKSGSSGSQRKVKPGVCLGGDHKLMFESIAYIIKLMRYFKKIWKTIRT